MKTFELHQESGRRGFCGCATSKSLFIYFIYILPIDIIMSRLNRLPCCFCFFCFFVFYFLSFFLYLLIFVFAFSFLFFFFFPMYLKQITNLHYDKDYRWQLTCWTVSLTYKGKGKWNITNTEMTKLANVDRADCQFLTQLMDDRQSNLYQVSPLNLFLRFDKATSFFFRGLRLKTTKEESCWFGQNSAKWFFQEPSIGVKKTRGVKKGRQM